MHVKDSRLILRSAVEFNQCQTKTENDQEGTAFTLFSRTLTSQQTFGTIFTTQSLDFTLYLLSDLWFGLVLLFQSWR